MFYSQDKQDQFLHENVFKGFRNGVFVDVGAHDGKSLNNTLFFEQALGWTGLNVEPLPYVYEQLKINRPNCVNINVAVDNNEGFAEFYSNDGAVEMLSGLVRHYHDRHKTRLGHELDAYGGLSNVTQVRTRPLSAILEENKLDHVHYLSIDVEGAELAVLQSIDFSKVFIDCIGFECNYEDRLPDILGLLTQKGYTRITREECIDVFVIHERSPFK